jgi:hypothetical protein
VAKRARHTDMLDDDERLERNERIKFVVCMILMLLFGIWVGTCALAVVLP